MQGSHWRRLTCLLQSSDFADFAQLLTVSFSEYVYMYTGEPEQVRMSSWKPHWQANAASDACKSTRIMDAFATRIRLYVHILRACGLSHQALTYHVRYALDAHIPLYEYIKRSTDMATIPSIYMAGVAPETLENRFVCHFLTHTQFELDTFSIFTKSNHSRQSAPEDIISHVIPRRRNTRNLLQLIQNSLCSTPANHAFFCYIIRACLLGNYEHADYPADFEYRVSVYTMSFHDIYCICTQYDPLRVVDFSAALFMCELVRESPVLTAVMTQLINWPRYRDAVFSICSRYVQKVVQYNHPCNSRRFIEERKKLLRMKMFDFVDDIVKFLHIGCKTTKHTLSAAEVKRLQDKVRSHYNVQTLSLADLGITYEPDVRWLIAASQDRVMRLSGLPLPLTPDTSARLKVYLNSTFVARYNVRVMDLPEDTRMAQECAIARLYKNVRHLSYVFFCAKCTVLRVHAIGGGKISKRVKNVSYACFTDTFICYECGHELQTLDISGKLLFARTRTSTHKILPMILCTKCTRLLTVDASTCSRGPHILCKYCAAPPPKCNKNLRCFVGCRISSRERGQILFEAVDSKGALGKYYACNKHARHVVSLGEGVVSLDAILMS